MRQIPEAVTVMVLPAPFMLGGPAFVSKWDDATTPRTDRPVTLFRTGPTPASQWGICRVIRAARASFPFGPQS